MFIQSGISVTSTKKGKWGWKKPAKPTDDLSSVFSRDNIDNIDNSHDFDDDRSSSSGAYSDQQSIHSIIKNDKKIINSLGGGGCTIKVPTDSKGKVQ